MKQLTTRIKVLRIYVIIYTGKFSFSCENPLKTATKRSQNLFQDSSCNLKFYLMQKASEHRLYHKIRNNSLYVREQKETPVK